MVRRWITKQSASGHINRPEVLCNKASTWNAESLQAVLLSDVVQEAGYTGANKSCNKTYSELETKIRTEKY